MFGRSGNLENSLGWELNIFILYKLADDANKELGLETVSLIRVSIQQTGKQTEKQLG